jgi:hypothetical protein
VVYAICDPAKESLECGIVEVLFWPPGRPRYKPLVRYKGFSNQAGIWTEPRKMVAKVEHCEDELFPRVGFVITNLSLPTRAW